MLTDIDFVQRFGDMSKTKNMLMRICHLYQRLKTENSKSQRYYQYERL